MDFTHIIPSLEEVNIEATSLAKSSSKYENYIQWLSENGCLYPSVKIKQLEFPVAFGKYGVVGALAKQDLASLKV